MDSSQLIELVGRGVDLAGVAVIVIGAILATLFFLDQWRRDRRLTPAYESYRQQLGRAILLGLELLVAADIIRTVAVSPTFTSLGVLAIIVLIRTFLSFTLELEINHRWPWEHQERNEGHRRA